MRIAKSKMTVCVAVSKLASEVEKQFNCVNESYEKNARLFCRVIFLSEN